MLEGTDQINTSCTVCFAQAA